MAMLIHPESDDIETLYVLLRQSLSMTEAVAGKHFPVTTYLLRVAADALEDDMRTHLIATAEQEARQG